MQRLAGILLAAGSATRFGAPKLLQPLADGTPMAVQAARRLRAILPESLAVLRPGDTALRRLLAAEGLELVVCPHAADGMGASLACGVAASAEADGWLVALADMPFVAPSSVAAVAAALRAGAALAAPRYRGRRGHPVGLAAGYRAELLALGGDRGARELLARDAPRLALIDCNDPGVLADIDTPADLAAPAARAQEAWPAPDG
jgi:molybdenum cofactor cytidylyltransferase